MKRPQVGSAAAAIEAIASLANGELEPPPTVHLREGDLPIWRSVMSVRARQEWTETDLQHAGNLVRCFADIERIQRELDDEGDTCRNDRGTVITNPKHFLIESLSRRAVTLTKMLHLHPFALLGPQQAVAQNLRSEERAAREILRDGEDDELLASPSSLQ